MSLYLALVRWCFCCCSYLATGSCSSNIHAPWKNLMLATGRRGCMPAVSLSADSTALRLDSLTPYPPMSTEISLRPGRCSMPAGAAPYLSHPFALKHSSSLSSLGIAPASKVRHDILPKTIVKCFRTGNDPLPPETMILFSGALRMFRTRWIREGRCESIPTSSSNTSLTARCRS